MEKTYRVSGPHPVHGTRPGETFTKCLDPGQERFLLDLGHIEIVAAPGPDPDYNGAQGTEEEQD